MRYHNPAQRLPLPLRAGPLTLRAPGEQDLDALAAIWGDPLVVRYWSGDPLDRAQSAAKLAGVIAANDSGEGLQWGIALQPDGPLIGTCTIWKIDRSQRRAELGIILAASQWGHGYASHALKRVLRHAFEVLALHRLEADIDPDNAASLRLFERQGFQREGLLRQRWFVSGQWRDTVLLGLLQPEWAGAS